MGEERRKERKKTAGEKDGRVFLYREMVHRANELTFEVGCIVSHCVVLCTFRERSTLLTHFMRAHHESAVPCSAEKLPIFLECCNYLAQKCRKIIFTFRRMAYTVILRLSNVPLRPINSRSSHMDARTDGD